MDLIGFVNDGWARHGDDPDAVAAAFPDAMALVEEAAHLPRLAALVTHVMGEHLGRWDEGDGYLAELLAKNLCPDAAPEAKAVWRSRAVLRFCSGDEGRTAWCLAQSRPDGENGEASNRVRVLAIAASALAGQRDVERATAAFLEALDAAAYGPERGDPAAQALAVTGNNLSAELEKRTDRSEEETALMLRAAETGRVYWERVGTWQNVERAEYRLAAAHLAAGDPARSLAHARTCLAICEANGSDPVECLFAHERIACAQHAAGDAAAAAGAAERAAACLARVEDEETRAFCRDELARLAARIGV